MAEDIGEIKDRVAGCLWGQAGYVAGKQGLQFNPPGRRLPMPGCRTAEQFIQLPVGQGKKLFNTLAA